ncbi:TPA: hypothetical protein HA246_02205 [Candidatus Woesearchaeota archaeon]|nr:hypothetical protein [Candidatus Woesearchaeota archaeon]
MAKKGVKSLFSVLIALLMIISLVVISEARSLLREDLKVKHLYLGDYGVVYPYEDTLSALVVVENLAKSDLDDLRVSLTIDELDLFTRSDLFDLDEVNDLNDHRRGVYLFLDLPRDVVAGEYLAKIVVENDDVKRTFYRPVWILR